VVFSVAAKGTVLSSQKPNLLRRLEARVRYQLGLPYPWVHESLMGRELVLRSGTIRTETDYDDAWLLACARHAEVMYDVGANVGQAALMALVCPNIKEVVLVEANWEALAVAAQNVIRNHFGSRARFVAAFAGDKSNSEVDFWTVGTGAAGSMYQGHAVTAARLGSAQRVPTVTLDELADTYGVVPDLVKIDVEGAEAKVLHGSSKCTSKRRTRFIVEMHSPKELPMVQNTELVLDWARSVGYSAWYLSGAVKLETPEPVSHRGRCHLLFQPSEWEYPEWLRGIAQSAELPRAI
jgi:FkbM family methyltransferase